MLSLTKTQMNHLNRFIKGVLVFLVEDNIQLARKIHASYDSYLRESFDQARLSDGVVQKCFDTCEYFSISLDTSLFGQDHILVCTVRFTFKTRLEQFPLFFGVCDASTGQELADFVFRRLQRNNVPLAKLVSVATDGAHNMVGQINGMVSHLKRLVQHTLGEITPTFDHVWCLAHRLNLVIGDFRDVPNIKGVFLFADWFTSKRKAVVYKKWLRATYPDQRVKKITKPSETRWSFYKVVLESLLAQVDKVEEFLKQDSDFLSFGRKVFALPNDNGHERQQEFFSKQFILCHFLFARFILDKVWLLNTELQEHFTILPVVWSSINRTKETFKRHLYDLQNSHWENFDYLSRLSDVEKRSFIVVLQKLLLNMEIRFPCLSTSIDIRTAKQNIDLATHTLNMQLLRSVQLKCPLLKNVDMFLLPDELIRERKVNEYFLTGRFPEIQRIIADILNNEQAIAERANQGLQHGTRERRNETITLFDVFVFVDRDNYPLLWKTVLKMMTMFPTSVSCEQYFSRLRNKLHENMNKETAFSFLSMTERRQAVYFQQQ